MNTDQHIKTLFIINPSAVRRNNEKILYQLLRYRSKIDVRLSEYPGHSRKIIKEEFENYNVFVAVGGDGTVNEIASELAGSDKKMAVFPAGSGNGFARKFGFEKNVSKLMKSIEKGNTIPTDVIYLNDHPCIHISGVGFDGEVVSQFEKLKRHGFFHYSWSVLQVIRSYQAIEAIIKYREENINGKFFMINIANTGQFGYNVHICPKSNPSDGKFELVLFSPFPKWKFPLLSLKMILGSLKPSKQVQFISVEDEVTILTKETNFEIEGEPVQIKSPVKIKIAKGKLNVLNPN